MWVIESTADVTYLDEDDEPFVSHRYSAFAWPTYAWPTWKVILMFLRMQEPGQAETIRAAFQRLAKSS